MSRAGKSEDLAGTRQRRPRYLPDPKSIPLFRCSSCFALYQVTIAEASPATADLKIECRVCNAPLPVRKGQSVLKYLLLRKASRVDVRRARHGFLRANPTGKKPSTKKPRP
jgi:hypothetical protein